MKFEIQWRQGTRALTGLALLCLFSVAGTAAADEVGVDRFATGLSRRLGYSASFIPEAERAKAIRQFLAGQNNQPVTPEAFLSGTSTLQLTSDPDAPAGRGSAIESPAAAGEAEYRFYVIRPGTVRVSARTKGGPQIWQIDEGAPAPVRPGPGWSDVESPGQFLNAGEHRLKIALPPGGALSSMSVGLPCVPPILPMELASTPDRLLFEDKTAAMVRALGREDLLPASSQPPIQVQANQFGSTSNAVVLRPVEGSDEGSALETSGDKGTVQFDLSVPEAGIYTIQAELSGPGQSTWEVNGCRVALVAGDSEQGRAYRLERVATLRLSKGSQSISATLRRGARLRRIVLQGRSESPAGYTAAASQLGLSEGGAKEPVGEVALQANLSNPAVEARRREFELMDRDSGETLLGTFLPLPDAPPEGPELPSETMQAPYDTPVSPYIPFAGLP